jgi:hypothetical protein
MRLPNIITRSIVYKLLKGQDYRPDILLIIDSEFLNYAINFFKKVAEAKLNNQDINVDWYRETMLSSRLPKEEIAQNAGLNIKTIHNSYQSTRREVVIDASIDHYEKLKAIIEELLDTEDSIGLEITITFRKVSVTLNISESLVVINALAVARAAIRGGIWSTAGKQVEAPLLQSLCALHRVPKRYFDQRDTPGHTRQADFYLKDRKGNHYRCEVKLMGKGNPESADAVFARDCKVFIADTLSELHKKQLNENGILWMELRGSQDWQRFAEILDHLQIPYKPIPAGKEDEWLEKVLDKVFSSVVAADRVQEEPSTYLAGDELLVDLEA